MFIEKYIMHNIMEYFLSNNGILTEKMYYYP